MINGTNITGGNANQCYIPIFQQQMGNMEQSLASYSSTWLIGARMLDDFYVVYDMETVSSKGTYRLGIGLKNQQDLIGDDI